MCAIWPEAFGEPEARKVGSLRTVRREQTTATATAATRATTTVREILALFRPASADGEIECKFAPAAAAEEGDVVARDSSGLIMPPLR